MPTTDVHALLDPAAPVIRYIGLGTEPKPVLTKRGRTRRPPWRRLTLHDAVPVGDIADFFVQDEIAHAIRAGHPLLNEHHLPVNLLEDPDIRAARDQAVALLADDTVEGDLAICADQAAAANKGVRMAGAHPGWRLDVRLRRTAAPPAGFRAVPDDPAADLPLLRQHRGGSSHADDVTADLLSRFAVVTTSAGLRAISGATAIWAAGPRARRNTDATAARFIRDGTAELRLPRREVGAILDRHVDGAVDRLLALPGVEVGRRDSLILTTDRAEQLDEVADLLIDMAVTVDHSDRKPIRQATTAHDTQQILLRASQAIVLAGELRDVR